LVHGHEAIGVRREPSGEAVDVPLITTDEALDELLTHVRASGVMAFDTEFVSEDTFEPVLCLVQVATRERLANIDPLAFRDLSQFWDVVLDPAVQVVMHAAGEDLRICRLRTGRVPARVFDVQIAAGLVGFGYPLSLSNLAHQTVGATLFGGETRTDWRRRPLSPGQLRYAVDDVRYLLPMADLIAEQLRAMSRDAWAEEEFRDFLAGILARDDDSRWRRLPGWGT
jgi:ribonuclease D